MKILFLDIDGVLNSERTAGIFHYLTEGTNGFGGFFDADKPFTALDDVKFDPLCVAVLKKFVESNDLKIVISSTWRKNYEIEHFKKMFALYDWEDAPVIDKTTLDGGAGGFRGSQVEAYVNENIDAIEAYVIFDDDKDFLDYQKELHFIHIHGAFGLQYEDIKNAQAALNKQTGQVGFGVIQRPLW